MMCDFEAKRQSRIAELERIKAIMITYSRTPLPMITCEMKVVSVSCRGDHGTVQFAHIHDHFGAKGLDFEIPLSEIELYRVGEIFTMTVAPKRVRHA